MALTFDDGPDPVTTPQILDVLASRGAKATFFVLGALAARHPDLIRRIALEGHVVAGHTWNHVPLPGMGEAAFRAEVLATNALVASLTGAPVRCVRPPEGVSDAGTVARLATHGLTTAQWSVDPRDWLLPGAAAIASRVMDGLHPGAVVVLHDRRTAHQTPVALAATLDGIAARGYRPVPICGGGAEGAPSRPEVLAFGAAPPILGGELVFRGPVVSGAAPSRGAGLRLATAGGGVFALGDASFLGSAASLPLRSLVVGTAGTPSGHGYWLVAADGGVFAFGDASFVGSAASLPLRSPVVGTAATPTGEGYWLVAADGGVFAFGDARFFGSTGGLALRSPVVGLAATPTGEGYWLVAADGGVFAFGDARFFGSTGGLALRSPVVGMAATPTGEGYWLVAADGGVFAFGDARFFGSTGGLALRSPVVGMAATPTGEGYWLVAADGGVFAFGDAPFLGSAADGGGRRAVGVVASPTGGYWLVAERPA